MKITKQTTELLENMSVIPFLVKTKCAVCGYDGMLIEVPINSLSEQRKGDKDE